MSRIKKDIHLADLGGRWTQLTRLVHMNDEPIAVRFGDNDPDSRRAIVTSPSSAMQMAARGDQPGKIVRVPYATAPAQLNDCANDISQGNVVMFVNADGRPIVAMVPAGANNEARVARRVAANSEMKALA